MEEASHCSIGTCPVGCGHSSQAVTPAAQCGGGEEWERGGGGVGGEKVRNKDGSEGKVGGGPGPKGADPAAAPPPAISPRWRGHRCSPSSVASAATFRAPLARP